MMTGSILRLLELTEQAFCNLRLVIPEAVLEDLVITVHKAMSVEGRHYHTPDHVLSLASPDNPVQSLAALFHDIVYYQVDRGLSAEVVEIVKPDLGLDITSDLVLPEQVHLDNLYYPMALDIFDFAPGQKLFSNQGFNEFLSTLVMAHKLWHFIPKKYLLQIMVYIEGTIPFRGLDAQGRTPFELLEYRLRRVYQKYHIGYSEQEIIEIIQGAVIFANKDVDNFADKDPKLFLVNTWKLLPETNQPLRSGGIYSVRDYRQALQHTDQSISQVVPELVFHRYRGVPTDEEYKEKVISTRNNLHIARQYLGIKLLAISILEALAEQTGGDAPLALFIGEVHEDGVDTRSLGAFLPKSALHPGVDPSSILYALLETGRANLAEFTDLRNSPLSIFIYSRLGPDGVAALLQQAHAMFAGNLNTEQFLQQLDRELLSDIAEACAFMVPTRSEKLRRYVRRHE